MKKNLSANATDISVTAALAIQWKNRTRLKANWPEYAQVPGKREDDLFKDDHMVYFTNAAVDDKLKTPFNIKMQLPLAVRTKYIRQGLSRLVKEAGVTQVISLGSGYDTLAVRKKKYPVTYIEIDVQNILASKLAIYREKSIDPNAVYLPGDYCQDLITLLKNPKIDPQKKTVIIWEGNTFYLTQEQIEKVLSEISSYFENVHLLTDYIHSDVFTKTAELDAAAGKKSYSQMFEFFKSIKAPFQTGFNPDEFNSLVKKFGFFVQDRKTASALAIEYQCDEDPYYTAKDYSLTTLQKTPT